MKLWPLGIMILCSFAFGASAQFRFASPSRPYVMEEEFTQNPNLVALPRNIAVLSLEAAPEDVGGLRENATRYQLGEGTYRFCLNKDEPYLRLITIGDQAANLLLQVYRGACEEIRLRSGVYRISAWHDPRLVKGKPGLAFLQPGEPNVSLFAADGSPKPGYWAIRPDPALDPTGQQREGRIAVSATKICLPYQSHCDFYGRPILADWSSQAVDYASIFDFRGDLSGQAALVNMPLYANAAFYKQVPNYLYAIPSGLEYLGSRINIEALGNLEFLFGSDHPGFFLDTNSIFNELVGEANPPSPYVKTQLITRFFPAVQRVPNTPLDLDEGEVALFTGKNFGGDAAVFALDIPNLSALSSTVYKFAGNTPSVRLGNNTAVILYTGANFTGTSQTVENDTTDLTTLPIGRNVASLQIRSLAPLFEASKSCPGCQLLGANLSGLALNGSNLQKAVLQGTTFAGSSLELAHFEGAILTGTHFEGADLTGAWLTGDDLTTLHIDAKTTLVQAHMASANLSQMSLANFDLQGVDLSGALLYGTVLNNVNLYLAKMPGAILTDNPALHVTQAASLTGANLRDVNLSNAFLSGANFTSANFYSTVATGSCQVQSDGSTSQCATAAGATMNSTNFSGAYLFGADFSATKVEGINFSGAFLVSASFAGAHLKAGPLGSDSGFQSAFLQGAILPASMSETSLSNAYVDFSPGGNVLTLLLDNSHTGFAGWTNPGQQVCIYVQYSAPSSVPANNTTITCPNGTPAGASGCGVNSASNPRWNNGKNIAGANPRASYLLTPSYGQKASPICSPQDPVWGQATQSAESVRVQK